MWSGVERPQDLQLKFVVASASEIEIFQQLTTFQTW